jgi:hypothetical protein
MPEWLEATLRQVPALAVLVFIVVQHARDRHAASVALMEFINSWQRTLKGIGDGCHEVQDRATKAVHENTRVLGQVLQHLENVDTGGRWLGGSNR